MENIIKIVSNYIKMQLQNYLPEAITYHNISHTTEVVDAVNSIGIKSGLGNDAMEMLLIAAWFHDVGYIDDYNEHEVKSAERCKQYLTAQDYPKDKIETISRSILSTKLPHKPTNFFEEIVCDADIAYIGKKDFYIRSQVLREEWEQILNQKFSDSEWIKINIDFLTENKFHNKQAILLFDKQRKQNLAMLKNKLKNIQTKHSKQLSRL